MAPVYRRGDVLVCSQTAPVRRGDRVVVKTTSNELLVKELRRKTARTVELASINPAEPNVALPADTVSWMARVMWVSQ